MCGASRVGEEPDGSGGVGAEAGRAGEVSEKADGSSRVVQKWVKRVKCVEPVKLVK